MKPAEHRSENRQESLCWTSLSPQPSPTTQKPTPDGGVHAVLGPGLRFNNERGQARNMLSEDALRRLRYFPQAHVFDIASPANWNVNLLRARRKLLLAR
ncbi:protein of unknown function [Ralstonia solanacearum CMR15]|nr:protein of unknown function [Ralstonia solanacearum CMR15]